MVILAHLGSAHTDAELGILLERARGIVAGGQHALDIEVAARAQSLADVPDCREPTLLRCRPPKVAPVAPPGRTTATSSRLLYDVIGGVYDWLGFGMCCRSGVPGSGDRPDRGADQQARRLPGAG